MTRVTAEPEPLEGGEFGRWHLRVGAYETGSFWEDVERLRRARTAWRIAKGLGELIRASPLHLGE